MFPEPDVVNQGLGGCDARHRSFVVVPETVGLCQSGVVVLGVDPFMRFGMAIGETERGAFPVIIAGNMIDIIAFHVDAKLRAANAERVDLSKEEKR